MVYIICYCICLYTIYKFLSSILKNIKATS